MTKVISFKYTKANGDTSNRILVVAKFPNKFYEGTDISELEPVDQVLYAKAVRSLNTEYLESRMILDTEFDVVNNYRRFCVDRMTNVVNEDI